MTFRNIKVAQANAITTITIDRPTFHNALDRISHDELAAAFAAYACDDTQHVAIITGAGDKAFCAGLDLKDHLEHGSLVFPPSGFGGLTARLDLIKPVIAAINGAAMGGGFELALACDLIVAVEHARFALPEPLVGLAAVAGGLHRLPRQIGLKNAMALLLTGEAISAERGRELGFVHQVVAGDALAAANRLAAKVLACSPYAIRATKQAVTLGLEMSLAEAMDAQWSFPALKTLLQSDDASEGPRAFAERRAPVWKSCDGV